MGVISCDEYGNGPVGFAGVYWRGRYLWWPGLAMFELGGWVAAPMKEANEMERAKAGGRV